jgi:metallophosphoesterase superfamily enzyme
VSWIKRLKCCFIQQKPTMEIVYEDRGMILRGQSVSALLISDLHLGYEEEILHERGVQFPSQHHDQMERIRALVMKFDVSMLYIIGDVKHAIMTDRPYNWEILPEFMQNLANIVRTVVIPGNHDGDLEALLPRSIELADVRGVIIGQGSERASLVHGHAWPGPDLLDSPMIVEGHSHPSASRYHTISSATPGREYRRRFAGSVPVVLHSQLNKNCVRRNLGMLEIPDDGYAKLVTLPSFNRILSGIAVNSPSAKLQGPFFDNSCADFVESEVFSIDGLYLGTVGWLRDGFNETIKFKPTGD